MAVTGRNGQEPPVDIGRPAQRAPEPVNRRAAILPVIGILAFLAGALAVQMPLTQSRIPEGLDDGGWLTLAVLAAVPVLVGGLAAVGLCCVYPRVAAAGPRRAAGRADRIRDAARRDVRWAAAAAAAGALLALGSDTSIWVTGVGAAFALLVALGWTVAARRAPAGASRGATTTRRVRR